MESNNIKDGEIFIDLECGDNASNGKEGCSASSTRQTKRLSNADLSSFDEFSKTNGRPLENWKSLVHDRSEGEESTSLLEKKDGTDRPREKARRKYLKPPRPPKSPSLNTADQKLVREVSKLATLKRARIERMKALKNRKNHKETSSSTNLCALMITILFCMIIIWQGMLPMGSKSTKFDGSPGSSLESLVPIQRNISRGPFHSRTLTGAR